MPPDSVEPVQLPSPTSQTTTRPGPISSSPPQCCGRETPRKVGVIHPPAFVRFRRADQARAVRRKGCNEPVGTGPPHPRLSCTSKTRTRLMLTIRQIVLGLVLVAGVLAPGQVLADRAPTPQERSRIETMLRNEGFTHWGKIELDDEDDTWEIYDAHASDGHRYDLRLHPDTLAILTRETYSRRPSAVGTAASPILRLPHFDGYRLAPIPVPALTDTH